VLRRCGGLPLAIAIAGSLKREPMGTWAKVLDRMGQRGGRALELERWSEEYPHKGLWEALRASVEHLKTTRLEDYKCLLWYGAFVEDTWVPLEIVRRVWGRDECDAIRVARSLAGRSLIELDVDVGGGWRSQAHDLLRDFLQAEAREAIQEEGVRRMHGAIIMQGLQACEKAYLLGENLMLEPYFGIEGVNWHLRQGAGQNVSRIVACLETSVGSPSGVRDAQLSRLNIILKALQQPQPCPALQVLSLNSCMVKSPEMLDLAEALRQPEVCPALQELYLKNNDMGPEGARALARALRQGACPALRHLDLGRNAIGDEGARALVDY
jgi:hypothetical protein